MSEPTIIPYDLAMAMQPEQLVDRCLDERGCAIFVSRTKWDDAAIRTELAGKNTAALDVAMLRPDDYSDFELEIAMAGDNEPLAVGSGIRKTTTVKQVETSRGQVVASTEGTETEWVQAQGEDSEAVADTLLPNGNLLTITTTIIHQKINWEHKLDACIAPADVYIPPEMPVHLLCSRHADKKSGESVSLVVWIDTDTIWHVAVERIGGATLTKPLRLDYTPSQDALVVSAAVSRDLASLYITESRQASNGSYTAIWYWYSHNQNSGVWTLMGSGTVPKPSEILSTRPYHVDRDGRVGGYWAIERSGRNETYNGDGSCSLPLKVPGINFVYNWADLEKAWGGTWSIISRSYSDGDARWRGKTIAKKQGSMEVAAEHLGSAFSMASSRSEYRWSNEIVHSYYAKYLRYQEKTATDLEDFSLSVAGQHLAGTTDYGKRAVFSGESRQSAEVFLAQNMARNITDMTCTAWVDETGYVSAGITPGGWVTMITDKTIKSLPETSFHEEQEYPVSQSGSSGWGNGGCPNLYDSFSGQELIEHRQQKKEIIYPFALGDCWSIDKSFCSVNESTGEYFAGCLVRLSENSPHAWHVYRNGKDVTSAVAACCGRPIDQLHAIYWRA